VRVPYRTWEFVSNPPPSAGGLLIAYALRVLDRLGEPGPAGSPQAVAGLAEVMRQAQLARGGTFLSDLNRGGLPKRLLS
jgi:gamma-glutamyltranspeptidase/glutathione hydrolase